VSYCAGGAQIGYFKDGWRNYVSHNKRPYDVKEAIGIYEHVAHS